MFKHSGVSATFIAAGAVTLLFALIPILLRERPGEKVLPWTSGKPSAESLAIQPKSWKAIGRNLLMVLLLPASGIIIVVIILIGGIQGIFDALLPVITVQELGWESDRYSQTAGISKLIAGLISMVMGGWLVNKWGHKKALSFYLILLATASVAMGLLPTFWENDSVSIGQMLIHHTCRTLALVTCFSIGMALCWKQIAASQFAFYMAFGNLGVSSGSLMLGKLSHILDYKHMFFVLAGIALLAIVVVLMLNIENHKSRIESFRS
jgi:MFS transporter, PAT family, beta-lactamase induction signal transducer AmpG